MISPLLDPDSASSAQLRFGEVFEFGCVTTAGPGIASACGPSRGRSDILTGPLGYSPVPPFSRWPGWGTRLALFSPQCRWLPSVSASQSMNIFSTLSPSGGFQLLRPRIGGEAFPPWCCGSHSGLASPWWAAWSPVVVELARSKHSVSSFNRSRAGLAAFRGRARQVVHVTESAECGWWEDSTSKAGKAPTTTK